MNKIKENDVCFHCGLDVPPNSNWGLEFDGSHRTMCCPGCEAVAKAIIDNGLADFYRKRTAYCEPLAVIPEDLTSFDVGNDLEPGGGADLVDRSLMIEGISCSACIWLLERHVTQVVGVKSFKINYANRRALLTFENQIVQLSDILEAIKSIGYRALPYDTTQQYSNLLDERKRFLSRIGVAVFCGMQVMMITAGIYMAGVNEIEPTMLSFLKWVSAFLTIPVVFFSAGPFIKGAYRDVKNKMPGMDVPVSLGITLGFLASLYNTYVATGDTYYESVCMFVLFLLLARYVEFLTRWHAMSSSERITQAVPVIAQRLALNGQIESIAATSLQLGDKVQINPGEVIPADSVVIQGGSSVDESILTGESNAINKNVGDNLLGGSHNLAETLIATVSCVGEDSTLSTISRLMERAHSDKPAWVELADRYASVFVILVILVTVSSGLYGYLNDNPDWFSVALSVLVVTCPCALSLATPTAYTAAMSKLFDLGIIVTKGQALEKLAIIKYVIFDKTGTLTQGKMRITNCYTLSEYSQQQALALAVSLEQFSDHPIAQAFKREKAGLTYQAEEVKNTNGAGLEGLIQGEQYYLGSKQYIEGCIGFSDSTRKTKNSTVYLANSNGVIAIFNIEDDIRQGAETLVSWLKEQGKTVSLISGDHQAPVNWLARHLSISHYKFDTTPSEKLTEVETLQAEGVQVAMVGDGMNDAPVMAQADVSISVSGASQLARSSSDILLMGDDMRNLEKAFNMSVRTRYVIKQNMLWALVYNIGALPLAISGQLEPWQAALGMSISSLMVVLNSFRLRLNIFSK